MSKKVKYDFTDVNEAQNRSIALTYKKSRSHVLNQYSREYHINYRKDKYNYNLLLEKQNHSCAICGVNQSDLTKRLAVDHCHTNNIVRGLLCSNCNTGLGLLGDRVELLIKAIEYLNKSK